MHISIELGRAVLSTSTANFELWLRTLITISPQQQCTDLEQRNATSILSLLSSDKVWVGRGNGLYIDLDLTFRGQPLADEQLQQLSDAILEAPVWEQLNLKPSLPYDAPHELGKLRMMVSHSTEGATPAARQRHRVLSNTSMADVRPPEGVPVFFLDSVLFCMDVFELIPKRNITTAKRLKTSTISNSLSRSKNSQDDDGPDQGATDALRLDSKTMVPSPSSSSTLKRPRSLASPAERIICLPITPPNEDFQDFRQICDSQKETPIPRTSVEITRMQTLIDGALRLSVLSSVNSKMLPGIKTKANTFGPGLADIAPTLWKLGYLSSLSQRAKLLPTISRSLCQPEAAARTTSVSLKQKLLALTARVPTLQPSIFTQDRESAEALDRSRLASFVAPQLWLHLQKYTPCKSTTSLQSFITAEPQITSLPDDILEEAWQGTGKDRRPRPSSVGADGVGASDVDRGLEGCPAATAACGGLSSDLHLLGAVATPEPNLEVDDELLLGDECFEVAKPVALRGSEVL